MKWNAVNTTFWLCKANVHYHLIYENILERTYQNLQASFCANLLSRSPWWCNIADDISRHGYYITRAACQMLDKYIQSYIRKQHWTNNGIVQIIFAIIYTNLPFLQNYNEVKAPTSDFLREGVQIRRFKNCLPLKLNTLCKYILHDIFHWR